MSNGGVNPVKKLIVAMLWLGVLSSQSPRVLAAADPKDEQAVMSVLEQMAAATVKKDVATLDKIYHPDLTYGHSSGLTQDKATVLRGVQGQRIVESMKFSGMAIRIYGNVALAKGITDLRDGTPGQMVDNHLNILWVLVRGTDGWQVVARQTTRVATP
jgi:ketosteroid isomerase-like protein